MKCYWIQDYLGEFDKLGDIMKIPQYIDGLYHVTLENRVQKQRFGERFGEVQCEVDFPSTSLIVTKDFIFFDDLKYDLLVTKQGHHYIIVNYKLL